MPNVVTRGDYEEITFSFKNPNGAARDISNDTITFAAKDHIKASVPLVTKSSAAGANQIEKTNPTQGQGVVKLQPADLSSVSRDSQTLVCELVATDSQERPFTTRFELTVLLDVSS